MLVAAALLTQVAAQGDVWFGISQLSAVAQIFTFDDTGVVRSQIGNVALGIGEVVQTDAMRCGFGFCLFETATADASYIYNVSWTNAALFNKATLPGVVAHNLHMDARTGDVWTITTQSSTSTYVISHVVEGVATPFLDISTYVPSGGMIWPGASTQCSALQTMYVAIDGPSRTSDTLLTIDLTRGRVTSEIQLNYPIVSSLWANCTSGIVGGSLVFSDGVGRRSVVVGGIQDGGGFKPVISDELPSPPAGAAPYELVGMITASESYTYVVPLYPGGAASNGTGGLLWIPTPDNDSESFVPINFYLIAAAVQW